LAFTRFNNCDLLLQIPGEQAAIFWLQILSLPIFARDKFLGIWASHIGIRGCFVAQTAVLDLAQQIGWDVVISLKQNQPDLYKSAVRLFSRRSADASCAEQRGSQTYQVLLWDTEGLPFSGDDPRLVRVIRSEETLTENHYRKGQLQAEQTSHEWLWITTLDPKTFTAPQVRRLGHDRWILENNGWSDLTQHWAFKHGFLHACRHRPQEITENGDRQPVDNRGLAAVTLILLLAFTLCSAFVYCHSKLVRRYGFTCIEVASQLRRSLSKLPPNIRAPD
jgi:hypothetical protein